MALFPEEKKLMEELVDEWYIEIHKVTKAADGIFSAKGKLYDVNDPVWTRAEWPYGFVHEINKKANRVKQLMSGITEVSGLNIKNIIETNEELGDINNYTRMFEALNNMLIKRWEAGRFCGYCGEAECDCEADPGPTRVGPGMATDNGRFLDNWPERSIMKSGETRIVGSIPMTPEEIFATNKEYVAAFEKWKAEQWPNGIPTPDTRNWGEESS